MRDSYWRNLLNKADREIQKAYHVGFKKGLGIAFTFIGIMSFAFWLISLNLEPWNNQSIAFGTLITISISCFIYTLLEQRELSKI